MVGAAEKMRDDGDFSALDAPVHMEEWLGG
jgi:hypothetical protein